MVRMSREKSANSNRATFVLFKEQLKDLLTKRIGGIHVRQAQYELEVHSGRPFPAARLQYRKFAEFLFDCREFVEVRSMTTVNGKDLFIYIKECTLSVSDNRIREIIKKTEKELLRSETVPEQISQVFFSLPRFFRPKAFVPGRPRQSTTTTTGHQHNSYNFVCSNGDSSSVASTGSKVGRVKRTSILNSGAQSPTTKSHALQFTMQNLSLEEEKDKPQEQDNCAVERENCDGNNTSASSNSMDMPDVKPPPLRIPEVTFPDGIFEIKLLGCDEKSHLYIRINEKEIKKQYKTMNEKLEKLSVESLQSVSLDSVEEGDTLLAYNIYARCFFRAKVMQKDSDDGSLDLYDVDTAAQLQRVVESTYVLPAEFLSLPPRAIEVVLDKHVTFLGSDSVYKAFDNPSVQSYYNCEYVQMFVTPTIKLPIVKLTESNGRLLNFRSLIARAES